MNYKLALPAKLNIASPAHLLMLTLLSVLFIFALCSTALANTLFVSSAPVQRGSVTPGLENIVMQSLEFRTDKDEAFVTAIRIREFGTNNDTATISSVKFYKETNGIAGLQVAGNADAFTTTTPSAFDADETRFDFSSSQVITDSPSTYYIVYTISQTALPGVTIGSRLVDQSYISVVAPTVVADFTNFQSNEIALVDKPHGSFSSSTNICQTCHAVHEAPDFGPTFGLTGENGTRRLLVQPYFESPDVVNTTTAEIYNALCFTCHDGTGAISNIKSDYEDVSAAYAGHETTRTSTQSTTGWKPPGEGKVYNASIKMPCMVCHDVHGSTKGNIKMLADGLYDYAKTNGWQEETSTDNGKIDGNDEECKVCHRYESETTRTSIVMGIDLVMPVTHNPSSTETPSKSTGCITTYGCHSDPHALN
ncbi:MAG: hypothetical protein AB1743_07475 [Actinomycetota bacterium]